eukprot:Selendium_serpulae@DN5_c0_g1_i1.p2
MPNRDDDDDDDRQRGTTCPGVGRPTGGVPVGGRGSRGPSKAIDFRIDSSNVRLRDQLDLDCFLRSRGADVVCEKPKWNDVFWSQFAAGWSTFAGPTVARVLDAAKPHSSSSSSSS